MHADVLSDEDLSCLFVGVGLTDTQKQPEVLSDVLQKLGLSIESKRPSRFDQYFYFVASVWIRVVSSHESGVDLAIGKRRNGFQDYDYGTEEFLLFVEDAQVGVAVGDVVQGEGLRVEIFPDAAHLDCVFRVPRTTICVWTSHKSDGVVALGEHQHPNDLLVAVDDEVPSEFVGILS